MGDACGPRHGLLPVNLKCIKENEAVPEIFRSVCTHALDLNIVSYCIAVLWWIFLTGIANPLICTRALRTPTVASPSKAASILTTRKQGGFRERLYEISPGS